MRVTTTDLQNAFGRYLALVAKEDIIVVKNGRSVAKLVCYTEPDFFIVHEEAKDYQATRKVGYEGLPTLIVEVLSPTTKGKDLAIKLHLYMKSGVAEYWIVDLDKKSIMQYSFSRERDIESLNTIHDRETIRSTVFADLALPLPEIFSLNSAKR